MIPAISHLRTPNSAQAQSHSTLSASILAVALQESERRLQAVAESSLQAKLVHRRFAPLFMNGRFAEAMGFATKEQAMAETDLSRLFDLETQSNPASAWDRAIGGGPLRSRTLLHRRDGDAFVADVYARPILWDDEPAIAIEIMDVTAEEAARRTLLHAKSEADAAARAKRRFLSATSHELRTPLHAAIGRLQLLRAANIPPAASDLADEAMRACQRLLHQVDDILDCVSLETGMIALSTGPFSPARAVEMAAEMAQDAVDGVSIQLSVAGDAGNQLMGDERRFRRLALALIEEATARGPIAPIEVQTCLDSEGVSIVLRCACANAQATGAVAAGGGAIEGMAMARMLASAMGGVLVERAPARHVWNVTVYLPLPAAQAGPIRTPLANPRVLVVEDNAGNRRLITTILTTLGCRPTAVNGGAEAIAEMSVASFDLVLMDLSMPGMDGFEAARRIRALPGAVASTPIVALTASCAPGVQEQAEEAGMDGFLQKPIEIARLAGAIAQFARAGASVEAAEADQIQGQ